MMKAIKNDPVLHDAWTKQELDFFSIGHLIYYPCDQIREIMEFNERTEKHSLKELWLKPVYGTFMLTKGEIVRGYLKLENLFEMETIYNKNRSKLNLSSIPTNSFFPNYHNINDVVLGETPGYIDENGFILMREMIQIHTIDLDGSEWYIRSLKKV